jgi:predicted HAD superfamily phosphohydrolase
VIFKVVLILIFVINAELSFAQIHRERDPFLLPAGIHPLSKGETATVAREEKSKMGRVKAILINKHIRLALIDRSIVTIGDSINDEKVVEIRPDQVILKKEGKKRTLFLYQSTIPLKVEEN